MQSYLQNRQLPTAEHAILAQRLPASKPAAFHGTLHTQRLLASATQLLLTLLAELQDGRCMPSVRNLTFQDRMRCALAVASIIRVGLRRMYALLICLELGLLIV